MGASRQSMLPSHELPLPHVSTCFLAHLSCALAAPRSDSHALYPCALSVLQTLTGRRCRGGSPLERRSCAECSR